MYPTKEGKQKYACSNVSIYNSRKPKSEDGISKYLQTKSKKHTSR
jgi:hypothetical protein